MKRHLKPKTRGKASIVKPFYDITFAATKTVGAFAEQEDVRSSSL